MLLIVSAITIVLASACVVVVALVSPARERKRLRNVLIGGAVLILTVATLMSLTAPK